MFDLYFNEQNYWLKKSRLAHRKQAAYVTLVPTDRLVEFIEGVSVSTFGGTFVIFGHGVPRKLF